MAGIHKDRGIHIRDYEINVDSNGNLIFQNRGITSNSLYYLSTYESLDAAITDIDTTEVTLVVDRNETLTSDITSPDNISLEFTRNGLIDVDDYTFTLEGDLDAGMWQVFTASGSGKVENFSKVKEIYPQWWGALGDGSNDDTNAIQNAINAASFSSTAAKTIRFIPGTYLCHEIDTPNTGWSPFWGTLTPDASTTVNINISGGGYQTFNVPFTGVSNRCVTNAWFKYNVPARIMISSHVTSNNNVNVTVQNLDSTTWAVTGVELRVRAELSSS